MQERDRCSAVPLFRRSCQFVLSSVDVLARNVLRRARGQEHEERAISWGVLGPLRASSRAGSCNGETPALLLIVLLVVGALAGGLVSQILAAPDGRESWIGSLFGGEGGRPVGAQSDVAFERKVSTGPGRTAGCGPS